MGARVVASIEARMNSSRLPGKMMVDIQGRPALVRVIERLQRCRRLDEIVVATTDTDQDDVLADAAERAGAAVWRGSEHDVLGRVSDAHAHFASDVVVEVNGDNLLLDPEILDMGVDTFLSNACDVVTNTWKRSWPRGMNIQVFSAWALRRAAAAARRPEYREHVSQYFYTHQNEYMIIHLVAPASARGPHIRCVLDYPEDLAFIRAVYSELEAAPGDPFGAREVVALIKRRPELVAMNRRQMTNAASA